MGYTFKVLELNQIRITKTVNIVAPNRFGVDSEIGFFIYEREISKEHYTLKTKDKNETDFLKKMSYPNETDYPTDIIDELIINAVKSDYKNSYVKSDLLFTTSDVEHIDRLTKRPFEQSFFTVRQSLVGKNFMDFAGQEIAGYRKSINIYTNGPKELIENTGFLATCEFDESREIFDKLSQIVFK